MSPYQPCSWGSITVVMQVATWTTPCNCLINTIELYDASGEILLATATTTTHITVQIYGKVFDIVTGKPISGVTVLIGTYFTIIDSTITDINGTYTISV
jgi:hypothetical protein